MADKPATRVEICVVYVATRGRYGYRPGSFFEAFIKFLLDALPRADMQNRAKLQQAWPDYVEAVENFYQGEKDLVERVQQSAR